MRQIDGHAARWIVVTRSGAVVQSSVRLHEFVCKGCVWVKRKESLWVVVLIIAAPLGVGLSFAPSGYFTASSGIFPNWLLLLIYALVVAALFMLMLRKGDARLVADGILELGRAYPSRPTAEFAVDASPSDVLAALRTALEALGPIASMREHDLRIIASTKSHGWGFGEHIEATVAPFGHNRTDLRVTSRPRLWTDPDGRGWNYRNLVLIHRQLSDMLGAERIARMQVAGE
jgi:hypothetical protein